MTVLLATHLSELVDGATQRVRSIEAQEGCWADFVNDLRARYPRLAARIFLSDDQLAPGFAFVLNDEVVHRRLAELTLRSEDEACILVTIAGGAD